MASDCFDSLQDPATGELRIVSGAVFDGCPSLEPGGERRGDRGGARGHSSDVYAMVTFVDPATGALRVATGSLDGTVRVWDADTGGGLLVIEVRRISALAFFVDPATARTAARLWL